MPHSKIKETTLPLRVEYSPILYLSDLALCFFYKTRVALAPAMNIPPVILKLSGLLITVSLCALIPALIKSLHAAPHMDHHSSLSKKNYAQGKLREKDVLTRISPRLIRELNKLDLKLGDPIFIRIFKESRELEIWVLHKPTQKFKHFKTWKIAAMSGKLGPKLKEGDRQAPEGFYFVTRGQMNPQSNFHLSFNLGYPNRYDRAHHRTGSALMVHGNRVSLGCFAMTDHGIEDIYTLCAKSLHHGHPFFRVHSFPFLMTTKRLTQETGNPNHAFWTNLKEGYDWFEKYHIPPNVTVREKTYQFTQH